ncbi:uncharacterized protein LOC133522869 [Cydia pomonella]|uniref:uncharacterized protein LOC133522869 n=1 Tax=Cydia pomonella TaxID=82600 RepID=UPI002ADE5B2D|nr:uncharacterized protein LOC133522869 [Cydia pomonella]
MSQPQTAYPLIIYMFHSHNLNSLYVSLLYRDPHAAPVCERDTDVDVHCISLSLSLMTATTGLALWIVTLPMKLMVLRSDPVNPLPFPACKANDIDCLRRGFRTFFFLMESGHMGMRPIDPAVVNSVAVTLPEQHVSFLLRRVNVTGAKWTKLAERRFHLHSGKSGAIFNSDLHVGAEIIMKVADRVEPYSSYITMDIQEVESNITYTWAGTNVNNEDYILIGPERIAVRNRRTPTYFLQPINNNFLDMNMIEAGLQAKTSVLDHFSNEIVTAIMHSVVDNFRLFARKIPVKYYYQYSSFI